MRARSVFFAPIPLLACAAPGEVAPAAPAAPTPVPVQVARHATGHGLPWALWAIEERP